MTTDATRSNAEQWHIQPQRQQLGEGMSPVEAAKQPVMAMSVIDLKPLIMWWQSQEQRLRDQVAVERAATSSAREELAACEERVSAMASKADDWRLECQRLVKKLADMEEQRDRARCDAKDAQQPGFDYEKLLHEQAEKWNHTAAGYVQQIKNLEKRAQRAEDKLGKAHCERDAALERVVAADAARLAALGEANRYAAERGSALADLECERARFERSLSELRSSATEQTVSLVPSSVPAVIEAYRLITGHEPRHIINSASAPEWVDWAWPRSALPSPALGELYRAAHELLKWLDQHAPGGKP